MMLNPTQIRNQVEKLTAKLVGLSLCDRQNYPAMINCGRDCQEIGIGNQKKITCTLKNHPYCDIYRQLERENIYNVKMLDGGLIQMMYRFRKNVVESHRLAFFPSPFLEEFQNNPDIYLEDEVYAEVTKKNIVPCPLRFDFDCREDVAVELDHPKSHLTLGQYENCRIPVSAPVTPYDFICFILRNFYNTAYHKYCDELPILNLSFNDSITSLEKGLIHIQLPST